MPLVRTLAGSRWQCAGVGETRGHEALELTNSGDARGLGTRGGRWGTMNDPTLGKACPVYACIFLDLGAGWGGGGGHHDARYAEGSPATLTVMAHNTLTEEWACKLTS